jgi:aspartyl protease family protein
VINGLMPGSIYIVMAVMLLFATVMSRRGPIARTLSFALCWVAILAAGFILFTFRDNFDFVWDRLRSEATGEPIVQGKELRIPMAVDGHFWVNAAINGRKIKFLVDSGATMTTIDRAEAVEAGVEVSRTANEIVRTGNGFVRVSSGRANSLRVGTIERRNFALHVTQNDDLNVLGMNFLSTLSRWGVEGRWLVLIP